MRASTITTVLATVLAASISASMAGTVALDWSPAAGATGYRVYYGTAANNYTTQTDVGSATQTTVSGLAAKRANELFDLIDKFAGYGCNKSHAAAYALLSYQTAWLKTHYPEEFYAASMCFDMHQSEKLAVYVDDLRRGGFTLLGPDINKSEAEFIVEQTEAKTNREGDILYVWMYARIDYFEAGPPDFFQESKASWPRMRRGFEQLLAAYPDSATNRAMFASFACRAHDATTYAKLRPKISAGAFHDVTPEGLGLEICDARFMKKA